METILGFTWLLGILNQISFSIDLSTLFTYAAQIISFMMPLVGLIGGIALGFALIGRILSALRSL